MKMQVEELQVLKNHDNSNQEELPEVANTVKEWIISDKYRKLVLKKHHQILTKRNSNLHDTYIAKQKVESVNRSPVHHININ